MVNSYSKIILSFPFSHFILMEKKIRNEIVVEIIFVKEYKEYSNNSS